MGAMIPFRKYQALHRCVVIFFHNLNLPENHLMKMIRLNETTFPFGRLMIALLVHHHFKLHFSFAQYIVNEMRITSRPRLSMLLEIVI